MTAAGPLAAGARVWVTRAEPGARSTADRLAALGFVPLVAPLLVVSTAPGGRVDADLDLDGVSALAFTSANGVAAFAARSPIRDLPVFTVGAATAAQARAAGFARVTSADGDVQALCAIIVGQTPHAGDVLHPGAAEAAGDLTGALSAAGVRARRVIVYETLSAPPNEETLAQFPDLAAVLLHSPRAAQVLADSLVQRPAPTLAAFCLSPNTAAPLAGARLARVETAARPTEGALLALLTHAA